MKFTFKIIIYITAIISIIFSIAGVVICHQNYTHALQKAINQNIENHLLERYGVENNIENNIAKNGDISEEKIEEYVKNLVSYLGNSKKLAIYFENQKLYSNIEIEIDNLDFSSDSQEIKYLLKDNDKNKYMIVQSSLEINSKKITFLSVYDITDIFTERDKQLVDFYKIDIMVILISLFAIAILSICLTKPIQKLNDMSKKIAKGSYTERINIKTNDEIGELSESFNLMIEAIETKIEELELSVKQREEFITNFTHELKNPMTSIIGYADILKSENYTKEIRIKAANYIFNEAKRLEVLAQKLMDLMGLSSENIQFEKINIVDFANKIYQDITENLGDIKLELRIEDSTIIADKSLLEDCIRNLIDNSKKAEPKDKTIIFSGKKLKDKYEIAIIDKGCGISKEDLPRIKESFYMGDKSRAKVNGRNGIGLSICEKIAKIHHTELEIESNIGEGTKVRLYLEVERDEI